MGKKVTVKLFEQTNTLMTCFDNPERTLETVGGVQEKLLKLIPMDPRGRIMFDYETEDTRDELELMDAEDGNEDEEANKSEHGTDSGLTQCPHSPLPACTLLTLRVHCVVYRHRLPAARGHY